MKKTVFAVMILALGLMFVSGSVYAGGDLYVMGKIGVGTDTPSTPLDVVGKVKIIASSPVTPASVNPLSATAYWLGGHNYNRRALGGKYIVFLNGSDTQGNATNANLDFASQETAIYYGRNDGSYNDTYTFTNSDSSAITATHQVLNNNTRNMSFEKIYGIQTNALKGSGSGKVYTKDFYHAYFGSFQYEAGLFEADNIYGLYLRGDSVGENPADDYHGDGTTNMGIVVGKRANAETNYGIVLAGDGEGADLAFGSFNGKRPKIYSDKGYIYADDANGDHTLISPHDPETGDWVYYSKNLKTGVVKQVNMERLVKAVEKLTGEKFMIETIEEVK